MIYVIFLIVMIVLPEFLVFEAVKIEFSITMAQSIILPVSSEYLYCSLIIIHHVHHTNHSKSQFRHSAGEISIYYHPDAVNNFTG